MSSEKDGFIAVHVGAGNHSDSQRQNYQRLCKEACKNGINSITSGKSYIDAVVEATKILENSPLTNAGFGSNLTLNGIVECDASIMDGNNYNYGAIGAVCSIKNPIYLAKCLCESQKYKISHGRIPPSFLVGNGAREWAQQHPEYNIDIVNNDDLISPKARKIWNHYKRKVENSSDDTVTIDCKKKKIIENDEESRLDTVGAIFVDKSGNVASACSSGGIILKSSGRVGQAGVWACGVWAESDNDLSIASSTTGCGEHLIKTTLAKTLAQSVRNNNKNNDDDDSIDYVKNIHNVMMKDFIESKYLNGVEQKLGGGIMLRYNKTDECGELFWTHSTNSMILGYMNSRDDKAKSFVSIMNGQDVGKKVVVEGVPFKL